MDMKKLIARMDAIESKKILKEDAAHPMNKDMAEGSGEAIFSKIASSGDNAYDMIYDGLVGKFGEEARAALADMYHDISVDSRLHPDDDFEEIQSRMLDRIEQGYGMSEQPDEGNAFGFGDQVDEFIKGTAPEKIAAWRKHIQDFKDKGMYKAADDATQSMKKVHPDYKKYPQPTPELRGGIAKALMQDMGMDDQEVEEDGETQMPDIPRVPMVSSDGQPVVSSDGQPVMSGGPTQQGRGKAAPIVNRDINKPDAIGVSPTVGPDGDATLYDYSPIGADNNPQGPQGTTITAPDGGGGKVMPAPGVDPAKIQRFQELLKKAQGGGGAAPAPAPGPKPKPGGGAQKPQANPIAAGYTQAQKNTVPGAGGVTESDDRILAMIRAVR